MKCGKCGKSFKCNSNNGCDIRVQECLCLECLKDYKKKHPHITSEVFDKATTHCFNGISEVPLIRGYPIDCPASPAPHILEEIFINYDKQL